MTGFHSDEQATVAGSLSRRSFLSSVGLMSATVVVAGMGGLTWRAWDQGVFATGEGPAYRAWTEWRDLTGLERAAASAILAASAHNSQPWLFVVAHDRIELHADPERNVGSIDPLGRELETSLGCALENLSLTLDGEGIFHQVTLHRTPTDTLAASVIVDSDREHSPSESTSGLVAAIPNRHSNRSRYSDKPLPRRFLDDLSDLATQPDVGRNLGSPRLVWLTEPEDRALYESMLIEAVEEIVADDEQSYDSHQWYRQDWDQLQARKDGITPDAQASSDPLRSAIKLLPATSRSQNDKFFVRLTRNIVPSAAAFGLVVVDDPSDRRDRLAGGRLVQRMHLAAVSRDVGFQHLNYVTERIDRSVQLGIDESYSARLAGLLETDQQLLVSFRVGIPTSAARPSPRRPLQEVSK